MLILVFLSFSNKSYAVSNCEKYDDCGGSGKYPYNCRLIDKCFFAGGSLFNPETKENNAVFKVREYLIFLKNNKVKSIISLNYSPKDGKLKILGELCEQLGLEHILVRMNAETVPNDEQTEIILQKLKQGAYVHCLWGCDRTGAIIAKYLTEVCGYTGKEAYDSVIKNGSHSGKLGGFKQNKGNNLLIKYFWPEGPQF